CSFRWELVVTSRYEVRRYDARALAARLRRSARHHTRESVCARARVRRLEELRYSGLSRGLRSEANEVYFGLGGPGRRLSLVCDDVLESGRGELLVAPAPRTIREWLRARRRRAGRCVRAFPVQSDSRYPWDVAE